MGLYKEPLVSIVIISYNYEKYILDALKSASAQSYKNIEIIVIDDGSTDDTKKILEKVDNIKFKYFYKTNGGSASARNYGVSRTSGEFVVFLDSDNMLATTFVEETLALLISQSPNVGFIYTQLKHFGDSNYITKYPDYDLELLKKKNYIDACCLIKSEITRKYHFDEKIKIWEDYDYYLTLAESHIYGKLLDKELLNYRVHGSNKDQSAGNFAKIAVRNRLVLKHWKLFGLLYVLKHNVWYIKQKKIARSD